MSEHQPVWKQQGFASENEWKQSQTARTTEPDTWEKKSETQSEWRSSFHPGCKTLGDVDRVLNEQSGFQDTRTPRGFEHRTQESGRTQQRYGMDPYESQRSSTFETSRGFDQGTRGYEQGNRGYDQGSRGYDQSSRSYDQGTRGYDQGSRGYDQGSRGYDQGSRGYDQGSRGYDQGSRGYDQGSRGWEQGNRGLESSRGWEGSRGSDQGTRGWEQGNRGLEQGTRGWEGSRGTESTQYGQPTSTQQGHEDQTWQQRSLSEITRGKQQSTM